MKPIPSDVLSELFARLEARIQQDQAQDIQTGSTAHGTDNPETPEPGMAVDHSYTRSLMQSGIERIAQKVGEEAVETVIAAVQGSRKNIINESADLLYHLVVLWLSSGVKPANVYAELQRREKKTSKIHD